MRITRTYSTLLGVALGLGLIACKSKEETSAPAAQAAQAAKAVQTGPNHTVFAASSHLRVVDAAAGKVVGRVQLQKAVREIRFTPDGRAAYVAASDGVRVVDATSHEILAQPTTNPTRYIELGDGGTKLYALEHWVDVKEDGTRTPQPFSLVTLDVATNQVLSKIEVGERVVYARPAEGPQGHSILVTESGDITVGDAATKWGEGTKIDPKGGIAMDKPVRVRKTLAHYQDHVFIPVEGDPARVVDIDTATGGSRVISLHVMAALRGLGVTPDGRTLLANTGISIIFVDLASGSVQGEALPLPDAHVGCAISDDGRYAYLAQVVDGTGGAVTVIDLKTRAIAKKIHLDDISPWAIGVQPRAKVASR